MRRLNVRLSQVTECIQKSLFAVDSLPRNPPLQKGELLVLQLVKEDAAKLGKLDARVEFALVFDQILRDPTGKVSAEHWPNAGKVWGYILVCSEARPAIPFSLENIGLTHSYAGVGQCVLIEGSDELKVCDKFRPNFEALPTSVSSQKLVRAIWNYDTLLRLSPPRIVQVSEHARKLSDPWPTDALKTLYGHRCQVCSQDFKPRYGLAHANVRFIIPIGRGGTLESTNRLVLCPNHAEIIPAAHAQFDRRALTIRYPNGLAEPLQMADHLESHPE